MMMKSILQVLKGSPYTQKRYVELIQASTRSWCWRVRTGHRLEEHLVAPETSSIFTRYPSFLNDITPSTSAGHLPPAARRQGQPEELSRSVEMQLDNIFSMNSQPTAVLTKASDALPAIGIVAACSASSSHGSIAGDKMEIGEHVAHALVGTFLGCCSAMVSRSLSSIASRRCTTRKSAISR